MLVLCEELAASATLDQGFGVGQGRGPIEPGSECFSCECRAGRVVATRARVDVIQQLLASLLGETLGEGADRG